MNGWSLAPLGVDDVSTAATSSARRWGVLGLVAALLVGLLGGGVPPALTSEPAPDDCTTPDRRMDLYAEELPNYQGQRRLGYGTEPGKATNPGPLIEMVEGECLAITLHNNISEDTLQALASPGHPPAVSLHVHGVKYTIESDGTMHTGSFVPPGESRTFIWYASPRKVRGNQVLSNGTAGYWWYHDHMVGTSHGTQGMNLGLAGGLIVRRPGDVIPDRTYTVLMNNNNTINYRRYPDTDTCDPDNPVPSETCFVANKGERVEFLVISSGNEMHTFHLHGHNWARTRTGWPNADKFTDTPLEDNRITGPGDSFGATVIAGEQGGPGSWMMHCHVQFHADLGMSTFFHVLDDNGEIPGPGPGPGRGHAHGRGQSVPPAHAAPPAHGNPPPRSG